MFCSSGTTNNDSNIVLNVPEVSETVLISFYSLLLLLLFHSASVIFTILSSISLICFSTSATVTLLLGSSAAAAAKSLQLCLTPCDIDGSPPGSTIPGILQARTLE